VRRPAPSSRSIKVMRSPTLTGVFSFCRPSRGPISTILMALLMSYPMLVVRFPLSPPIWRAAFANVRIKSALLVDRFDFGELHAFLDDIAYLAFDDLQYARKGRTQGLFHLHHLQRQDRRALLQCCALPGKQGNDRAGQGCDDLVLPDLLFRFAAEGIDPMHFKAAVGRP